MVVGHKAYVESKVLYWAGRPFLLEFFFFLVSDQRSLLSNFALGQVFKIFIPRLRPMGNKDPHILTCMRCVLGRYFSLQKGTESSKDK